MPDPGIELFLFSYTMQSFLDVVSLIELSDHELGPTKIGGNFCGIPRLGHSNNEFFNSSHGVYRV